MSPFQNGDSGILGQLEHALVKSQPAQLAIKVAVDGKVIRIRRWREIEVIVDVRADLVNIATTVGIHVHILARERIARRLEDYRRVNDRNYTRR